MTARLFYALHRRFIMLVPRGPERVGMTFLDAGLHEFRRRMARYVIENSGNCVQSGPFSGMELIVDASSWGDGDCIAKLLGSYEAELHPVIEKVVRRREYQLVVNIGCAEGYYAVGLGRLMPWVAVRAYDISDSARRICRAAADQNGIGSRVIVGGLCTTGTLADILPRVERSFLLLDCEGAEKELLRPDLVPGLRTADVLVECHDFIDRDVTPTLVQNLSPTHNIQQIEESSRNTRAYPPISHLGAFERQLALCEFRPEPMHWLYCTPKAR